MKASEVAVRYAKATYELAIENNNQEKVYSDLRALKKVFETNLEVETFFSTPLVNVENKELSIKEAVKNKNLSNEVENLICLLAERNRLPVFNYIVDAYEVLADEDHGVQKGDVRSAITLSPEQRSKLEKIVTQVTKKQVVLNYKTDTSLIGGLVAKVGSYTFDDTIDTHIKKLNDELKKRRTN